MFYPNVYLAGTIYLSIINEREGWMPNITIRDIRLGIQTLLDEPNLNSLAQSEATNLLKKDPKGYERKIGRIADDNPRPWEQMVSLWFASGKNLSNHSLRSFPPSSSSSSILA
jgi:hypothetical protein